MLWAAWADEWALVEPVSFDGRGRAIVVNAGVDSVSVQTVYSAWKRWMQREQNAMYPLAMRAVGGDPIPGGVTGSTYFMVNGWRLLYDPNTVAVAGVLYSEDYDTAFWSVDGTAPIYPATVSSLVNQAVSVQNVVTGTALTPEQTAAAVWGATTRTLTSLGLTVEQIAAAILAAAQVAPIHADMRKTNNEPIVGDGTEGNKFRSHLVP